MTMQRWDPFNDLYSLRQAMDQLLEDAVIWPGRKTGGGSQGVTGVPIDLAERDNELVVKASLPGLRPEDITVNVQGSTLTIEGESHQDTEHPQSQNGQGNGHQAQQGQAGQPRYHYRERRSGHFFRQIALPVLVESNRAEARFENGEVTVTLPKAQEARPQRIPVTTGSQPQLAAGRAR